MSIVFDPVNLYAAMAGDADGLRPDEVRAATPRALDALKTFQQRVEKGDYGFPHQPFQAKLIREIQAYARKVAGTYDTVCVVGIGGSALGAWALDCGVRGPHPVQGAFSTKFPRLVVLDNVDPVFVSNALASMNPARTLLVPIAKSGETAETISVYLIVQDWLKAKLGAAKAKARTVVVTGKGTVLDEYATGQGFTTFYLPDNVGGRFSVLSAVGLLPAALIGIDIAKLCRGAAEMTSLCWKEDLRQNIALHSALLHHLIWTLRGKTIQVAFPYVNNLWGMAFWFRQLWAESLGKAKTRAGEVVQIGQTPVAALGTTDQHSQVQLYMEGPNDKVFSFWAAGKWAQPGRIPKSKTGRESFDYLAGQSLAKLIDAERQATAAALSASKRPNCTYVLEKIDAYHLGAFIQMLEFQTAFAGELLGINAFDQPGVQLAKNFTYGLMGRKGFENYKQSYNEYEAKRGKVRN